MLEDLIKPMLEEYSIHKINYTIIPICGQWLTDGPLGISNEA
jgi:hypothetical protein